MSQDHSSAAVALATELVECLASRDTFLVDEVEVTIPLIAHDLQR